MAGSWQPDIDLKAKLLSEALDIIKSDFQFLDGKLRNQLSIQLDGGYSDSDWEVGKVVDGGGAIDL